MKKYIIMLLTVFMLVSTAYAQADKDYVIGDTCHTMMEKWFGDEVKLMSVDTDAEKLISDYMDLRLSSLTDKTDFDADYLSDTVAENERKRRTAISEMEQGRAIEITDTADNSNGQCSC